MSATNDFIDFDAFDAASETGPTSMDDDLINFDDYASSDEDGKVYNPDEDDIFSQTPTEGDNPSENSEDINVINELLKAKGFADVNSISITNEDGTTQNVPFSELSNQEQLEILSSPEIDLTDEEINTLNFFRQNNITLQDYITHIQEQTKKDALSENTTSIVDEVSDENLFITDLKSKFPSLTDEEAEEELDKELNNPELFAKKIEELRKWYKEAEEAEAKQKELEQLQAEQQAYEQTRSILTDTASKVSVLHDIELEDTDRNQILQYLLEPDATGKSEFVKDLDSPDKLFKLAWYAVKGDEAFNMIKQYYAKQLDSGKKSTSFQTTPPAVRKPKSVTSKSAVVDKYDLDSIFNK